MKQLESEKLIWFRSVCVKNGLSITIEQIELLFKYAILLLEWNQKIDLISRKDESNIWDYHILHCISMLFKIKLPENSIIVDIGTGGGLPGIPLKIVMPKLSMLCIDSVNKKVKAVNQMIDELKLKDIKALWGRAEDVATMPEYKNKFDFAIARSVAPLVELIDWSKNFLKKECVSDNAFTKSPALITYKGGDLKEEINNAKKKNTHITVEETPLYIEESELLTDKKIVVVYM